MPIDIVRHPDVDAFAGRATPWLMQAEAEHNLLLGIIQQLKANRSAAAESYLATIEENHHVVGCAFRTSVQAGCHPHAARRYTTARK
jgi:hypothetical protein